MTDNMEIPALFFGLTAVFLSELLLSFKGSIRAHCRPGAHSTTHYTSIY